MSRFDGQVCWITGGGSGIGRALAAELVAQGARVAISGRREDKLRQAAESIGEGCFAVPCDVADEESVAAAVAAVLAEAGQLDMVVANAGVGVSGKFEAITTEQWKRQFDINVIGAATTVRHALPALRKTRGRVVLIASVASMVVYPMGAPYAGSKHALRAMGLALSLELYGTGVSCTTIHPGFVESEIVNVDNDGKFDADLDDPRPQRFMWKADRAARVMANAIYRRKREYTFTWHGVLGAWLGRHMPGLVYFIMERGAGKATADGFEK